jgi:pimeloyl-ACP methyl ester carboxylesterase
MRYICLALAATILLTQTAPGAAGAGPSERKQETKMEIQTGYAPVNGRQIYYEIRGIAAPTLVIVGDADHMRPEHAVETFQLLPHAQLAVLPGTEHMTMMTRTAWLVPMIDEFLDAAMPSLQR